MTADLLRKLLEFRPFRAFDIQLSSGQVYEVRQPEFTFVMNRTIVIGYPYKDLVFWPSIREITEIRQQRIS